MPPVLESGDYTLIPVKEDNLFFVSAMKSENSPLMVVEFINKIITLIKTYIGSVSEVKIRSNFSLVYQVGLVRKELICSFSTRWQISVFL